MANWWQLGTNNPLGNARTGRRTFMRIHILCDDGWQMVTKQFLHPCDWGLSYLHHQVTMQCHKAPQSNYLVCPQTKNDQTKCSLVGCKTKHKTAHALLDIRGTEDSVGDFYCNSYVSSREIFLCLRLTTSSPVWRGLPSVVFILCACWLYIIQLQSRQLCYCLHVCFVCFHFQKHEHETVTQTQPIKTGAP